MMLFILVYKYNYVFYNISSYYYIISYLNTKSNFVILSVFICIYILNKNFFKKKLFFLLILFIYEYNYLEVNKLFFVFYLDGYSNINVNLLNGVMLVHPVILYTYYCVYLYIVYALYYVYIDYAESIKHLYKTLTMYILVSIILGCWWAEQELSWGGWWSWDFIELIALNFFILNLVFIHNKNTLLVFWKIIIKILIFVCSVLFVRFNLINSIHNFISAESQNQFLYYVAIFIVIALFVKLRYLLFINNTHVFKKKKLLLNSPYIFLKYLIVLYLLYTLLLFSKNININSKYMYHYMVMLMVIYHLNFIKKNTIIISIVVFLFYKNVTYTDLVLLNLCLLFFSFYKNINMYLHITVLYFFYVTLHQIYLFNFDFINLLNTSLFFVKYDSLLISVNYYNYIVDNNYITALRQNLFFLLNNANNNPILENFFKNIFEKKIFLNSGMFELFSYNLQELNQPNGFILFLVLICLVLAYVGYIKNKNKNIFL
jgi:cytochrome c biogenesis factor